MPLGMRFGGTFHVMRSPLPATARTARGVRRQRAGAGRGISGISQLRGAPGRPSKRAPAGKGGDALAGASPHRSNTAWTFARYRCMRNSRAGGVRPRRRRCGRSACNGAPAHRFVGGGGLRCRQPIHGRAGTDCGSSDCSVAQRRHLQWQLRRLRQRPSERCNPAERRHRGRWEPCGSRASVGRRARLRVHCGRLWPGVER